jgi:ATPase subunit of ABC transporter with duplicated ATPase domains
MISIRKLSKVLGTRVLFKDVTLSLNLKHRYGIVGANGSGKSTFLRVLSGEESATDGEASILKGARLGILRQEHSLHDDEIILQCAMRGDEETYEALRQEKELSQGDTLATRDAGIDPSLAADLHDIIAVNDGYTLPSRAAAVLEGLGIANAYHGQTLRTLSGGFKWRVLLAQVLLSRPDILFLDEPTNHLDILSIRWLERFLSDFAGCVLVVSHDRRFLDNVCTDILDVDYETVTPYVGNYGVFEKLKTARREQREAEIANIKKDIEHKQAFIDRFKAKASKARQAQSRIKQIERIEIPELVGSSRRYPRFAFEQSIPSGKEVVGVQHLTKSFGDKRVLNDVSLRVRRGERIGIIGPNGVGKSTLLKIIMGEVAADGGKVEFGHEALLGYFAQDHDARLRREPGTPETFLNQYCDGQSPSFVRGHLSQVLFTGDDVKKDLSTLSGGELARLCLARLVVQKPNTLLLDEPTNHLDTEAIDALVAGLKAFPGTLVFVSHDRWFVSELATKIVEILPTGVRVFDGTFDEYIDKLGDDHLDVSAVLKKKMLESQPGQSKVQIGKTSYEDTKARKSELRRLENELGKLQTQMDINEKRMREIDENFCMPDFFTATPLEEVRKLDDEKSRLSSESHQLFLQWEEAYSKFEDISKT